LRIYLVEFKPTGKDCWNHLAGAGDCLRSLENFVVP